MIDDDIKLSIGKSGKYFSLLDSKICIRIVRSLLFLYCINFTYTLNILYIYFTYTLYLYLNKIYLWIILYV